MNDSEQRQPQLDEEKEPHPVGRTSADALVEIVAVFLRVLGKAAPFFVVVALLVAGVLGYQWAIDWAGKNQTEQLRAANEVLRETFSAISTQSKQQIEGIKSLLDLQSGAIGGAENAVTTLRHLRDEVDTAETQAEKARAAKKIKEATALENDLLRQRLVVLESRVAAFSDKIEEIVGQATRSEPSLESYRPVVEQLRRLSVEQTLADCYAQPQPEVCQRLLGMKSERVVDALKVDKQILFLLSPSSRLASMQDLPKTYWVVGKREGSSYKTLIQIETDRSRVASVATFREAFAVRCMSPDDWTRPIAFVIFATSSGGVLVHRIEQPRSDWQITDLPQFSIFDSNLAEGGEARLPFLTWDDFSKRDDDLFDAAKGVSPDLEIAFRIDSKAKNPHLSEIWPEDAPKAEGLEAAFVGLLSAAVGRHPEGSSWVDDSLNRNALGRIAAAVLRPGFWITKVDMCSHEKETCPDDGSSRHARIEGAYGSSEEAREKKVLFVFRRSRKPAGWKLTEFHDSGPY